MAVGIAIGALLLLDGLYVAVRLYIALSDVRERLNAAETALGDGQLGNAETALVDAKSASEIAVAQGRHPSFVIARVIPGLSSDARALQAMSEAARLSAEAGLTVVRVPALRSARQQTIAQTVYQGGRVNFDLIDQLDPRLRQAQARLADANALLEDAPTPLLGPVHQALDSARSRLSEANNAAARGHVLMDALPSLLARDGSKHYLLALQTPSEARGGGGLLGVYGVLEARDGRLRLTRVAPIGDLVRRGPVRAENVPRWFKQTYGGLGALRQYQQANLSPYFPVTASAWLDMYEDSTHERLDGVLAMDPIALGELTRGTGPIRGPGLNVQVGPGNAARVLLHDSYTEFAGRRQQDAYLAGLVQDFWSRVIDGSLNVGGLVSGLSNSVAGQHLKIYSISPADQNALAELESDGSYTNFGPNVQVVFNNNSGVNKIDYFLMRQLNTSIALHANGSATITTTADLTNTAPLSGGPSLMRGPGIGGIRQPGLNAMLLHFLLPEDSRIVRFEKDGRRRPPLKGREGSHPVAFEVFDIRPQSSGRATIVYEINNAFAPGEHTHMSFTLVPQATSNPDRFEVTVTAPDGYTITDAADATRTTSSGLLTEPRTITVTLER